MSDWKIVPALAARETLTDQEAEKFLASDAHRAEQKLDGDRLVIHCHEGKVIGVNRKGNVTLIPKKVGEAFSFFDGSWVFDGEIIKDKFYVFDMPRALEVCKPSFPYNTRRELLEGLWPQLDMPDCVQLVPSYLDEPTKRNLVEKVRESRGEGLVFKKIFSPYRPSIRTLDWRKWKFLKTIDVIVMACGIDGKANLSVGLVEEETGEIIEVTTVSALSGDGPILKPMDVCEITFLYASEDLRLVQPVTPKLRRDKDPRECILSEIHQYVTSKEVV